MILENYRMLPANAATFQARRRWWEDEHKPEIQSSVHEAMKALNVDASWDEINKDPLRLASAKALFTSVVSCLGANDITPEIAAEINRRAFGESGYGSNLSRDVFSTANHRATAVILTDLGSDGKPLTSRRTPMNMPMFARSIDGKPSISQVSPIKVVLEDGQLLLLLSTPSGHIWKKLIEVSNATFANQLVGNTRGKVHIETITQSCGSPFRVWEVRRTCRENCIGCNFDRGDGEITELDWIQFTQAMTLNIVNLVKNGHKVQATLSGGSLDWGDGGFESGIGQALEKIDGIVSNIEKEEWYLYKYGKDKKIPVELELEIVLPSDRKEWGGILDILDRYFQKGWKLSVAANLETPIDEDREYFLRGNLKKATTTKDHIDFAHELKNRFDGKITMNTLLMFGMKRAEMGWKEYMNRVLKAMQILIDNGITVDLVPFKIELGETETLPPVDPVFYKITAIALKQMLKRAKLPWSPGCDGGCGRCHNPGDINALIQVAGNKLLDLLEPLLNLNEFGSENKNTFTNLFSKN